MQLQGGASGLLLHRSFACQGLTPANCQGASAAAKVSAASAEGVPKPTGASTAAPRGGGAAAAVAPIHTESWWTYMGFEDAQSYMPAWSSPISSGIQRMTDSFEALGLQFFMGPLQGGLVLMAVGIAGAALKRCADLLWEFFQRQCIVRVQVDSRDDAYRWLMHWLSAHSTAKESRNLSVSTSLLAFGSTAPGSTATETGIIYIPAPGEHVARYRRHHLWLSRVRTTNDTAAANKRLLTETLLVTLLGRDTSVIKSLIEEARQLYLTSQREHTCVYTVDADGFWMAAGARPSRPISSVILPQGVAQALHDDCAEFLASEAWYTKLGVPYRRGYLLYGPPGTGKTSLVKAIAGSLGLSIYVVTLSSPSITDDTLRELLTSARERGMLLLEDVDSALRQRGETSLSFSGLLNAIDGVAAQEGKLLFMTTNHVEHLDAALIRPGRVDVRCEFSLCSREQAAALFVRFYEGLVVEGGDKGGGDKAGRDAELHRAQAGGGPAGGADEPAGDTPVTPPRLKVGLNPSLRLSKTRSRSLRLDIDDVTTTIDASTAANVLQPRSPASAAPPARGGAVMGASGRLQWRGSRAELEALAEQFAAQAPEGVVSPAALQGYLMQHKRNPAAAALGAQKLRAAARGAAA